MISVEDFTKRELINAICRWLRHEMSIDPRLDSEIISSIEDGTWLEWYDEKLDAERPHNNC